MPWVKLDDRFPSHRKVALLSDRAFRLYVSALCWSSENLTEGRVADRELLVVSRIRGAKTVAKELEAAGLWDRVAGAWVIHDYLVYNPDRQKVKDERAANAARQAAFRERKKAQRDAEKGAGNARSNAPSNGVTDSPAETPDDSNATRTRHDGDTNARKDDRTNQASPQVSEIRNGVSNGTPSPAPTPFSPNGEKGTASKRSAGLPDQLADLKQAIAAAGLTGISWRLTESQWEYTRQARDRVGTPALVACAVNNARLKGIPAGASAWVEDWRSLEPTPDNGVIYLSTAAAALPRTGTDARVAEHYAVKAQMAAAMQQHHVQELPR